MLALGFLSAAFVPLVWGQSSTGLQFEAATVKPNLSINGSSFGGCHAAGQAVSIPAGRCVFRRMSLRSILAEAYRIPALSYEYSIFIAGEPGWVNTEHFDIEAKAEDDGASFDDLTIMLRNLISERFKLAVHESTKEAGGYALVLAKGGGKIKPAQDSKVRSGIGGATLDTTNCIAVTNAPIGRFATRLSRILQAPVIDSTGLTNSYTFTLSWSAEPDDPSAAGIFGAIQEQLGLKLEAKRVPVKIFIIDHVERPAE